MTFNYKHATAVVKHYQFLKGRDMQGGNETPVTGIVVAPVNDDQLDLFFDALKKQEAPDAALDKAGYDKTQVQVLLINEENKAVDLWEEIDSFLESNKLDRAYLNPDFFD